jgi:hypothetical protein
MSAPFLFTSGLIVLIIFLIGIGYTYKEFQEMIENPSEYRRDRSEEPDVVDKK